MNSLNIFPLILSTLMITQSLASSETITSQDSLDLKIMSFNIRYGTANDGKNSWSHRRNQVMDLIAHQKADVIGLQEALRFQLDEIRGNLHHYGEIGKGRDDGLDSGEHSTILYQTERFKIDSSGTFWLSETPSVPGSKSWGNKLPRICTWAALVDKKSHDKFFVYNMHLDHRNANSRWNSIALMQKHIKLHNPYNLPVIILGDFNVGEGNPLIKYMRGKENFQQNRDSKMINSFPLEDTFRNLHPKAQGGTFHMFWGKGFGPKLDYIFVNPETKILHSEIIRSNVEGRYPSDHFPITADVRLFFDRSISVGHP